MSLIHKATRINVPGMTQIIPVMAVLMETIWAYAWLVWISGWDTWGWNRPPLTIFSCLLLVVFTEVISRTSLDRDWSLKRVRLIVLPSSIILLLIMVRWNNSGGYSLWDAGWWGYAGTHLSAIVTALIFGTYLIWRGIAAGHPRFSFSDLYRKFVIGMVMIVLLLIMWGFSDGHQVVWSLAGAYIVSYFGIGLLTLAMANLQALRAELLQHKEDISAFSRRWLSMLVVLIMAILGIAVAVASAFSNNIWGSIIHGLGRLIDWLFIALGYILLPLGYILEAIIFIGRWLIKLISGDPQPIKFNMEMGDLERMAEQPLPFPIPPMLIMALKWGFLLLIVGLVIFFLSRALIRYWEGKAPKEIEEVHETVWSWGVFKMDLRLVLAWMFRWLRRRKKTIPTTEVYQPPLPSLDGEALQQEFSVRELYTALLWEGRQMGTARRPAETPYEYRKKLTERIDRAGDEIDALTEAYIVERYGQVDSAPEKVSFLNRVWRKLRSKILNKEE